MLPMKLLPAWLLLCGGVVLASVEATAADATPQGYTTRLWQTEDGLPANSVTAVTQTRDGYLWVGTYSGLARFDGVRFRKFDAVNTPELRDARIVCLYEDPDGALWIGHDSGLVTRFRDGRFETLASRSPHAAERLMGISSDATGRIWILRDSGRLETVDGAISLIDRERSVRPEVLALARGADGTLYVDEDGEVSRLAGTRLQRLHFPPAQHTGFAIGIGAAQQEGVWIARDWVIEKHDGDAVTGRRGATAWGADVSLSTLLEMRDGALAIGTVGHGLYLCPREGAPLHLDHTHGLPQDWIRALCEDREGNLWLGVGSGGLVEVVPTPFTVISPPGGWDGRTELAVASDHSGALWIGTEGAGLYRYARGTWTHFGQDQGLGHPFVWAIAEGADGAIYAGTWGGGIFRGINDRFERVPQYDPEAGPVIGLEYVASAHELWIAGAAGLIRWPDGSAPQQIPDTGRASQRVFTVVRDAAGVVWFGGAGTGLGRLEHNEVRRFHKRDGLPDESILSLYADPDGTLWIGSATGGLVRCKGGRFSTIGLEAGLPSAAICHINSDTFGYFWLSTHHGLVRVARADLERCADGATRSVPLQAFDRNDGLPTIEFSGGLHAAGCTTPDGRIWFPSSKGVLGVNPAMIRRNRLPPPVVLEAVQIDGRVQEFAGRSPPELRLPPDHERLEFQYTALSLSAPGKVAFKYRLDGIDKSWVDAGTKRTASYSRLPAGRYVFHVIACNNDGVWNQTGASIAYVVLPFFWQTWWFIGATGVGFLALVIAAVRHLTRRRLQRRLEELERRHAIERERARIARDIHDDIGATLTRITMLSQCLPRGNGQETPLSGVVEQIYDTAREATRSLDEIVWAVNPRHDSLEGLVTYMGKFAQDYLAAAGVRCRLDVPVNLPEWPVTADVRHNLFLAFKEALNNTVKHAHATEVRIGLRVSERSFVLTIADDGAGFVPAAPAPATPGRPAPGNGLNNLRRRLAGIGGSCEICSTPGVGTEVAFTVSLRAHDAAVASVQRESSATDHAH